MILPIRLYGDPVLQRKAAPVSQFANIPQLAADMLETMYAANGVGLAAPQVGVSKRLFVAVEYADDEAEGEQASSRVLNEFVVVNPRLEWLDEAKVLGVEGCLSIPELYIDGVPRKRALRLHYQNEHGEHRTAEAEDYLARVFQHEYDHLDGRLYLELLPTSVVVRHRNELIEVQKRAKMMMSRDKARLNAKNNRGN
jgi:peptide deformylase